MKSTAGAACAGRSAPWAWDTCWQCASHILTLGSGRTLTAAGAARLIPRGAWQRMRTGHGTKGSRHHDWAMLEVTSDDVPATIPATMMPGGARCWSAATGIGRRPPQR